MTVDDCGEYSGDSSLPTSRASVRLFGQPEWRANCSRTALGVQPHTKSKVYPNARLMIGPNRTDSAPGTSAFFASRQKSEHTDAGQSPDNARTIAFSGSGCPPTHHLFLEVEPSLDTIYPARSALR